MAKLWIAFVAFCIPVLMVGIGNTFCGRAGKLHRLRRYKKINIGDSEESVVKLIGKDYSLSSLMTGEKVYSWSVEAHSDWQKVSQGLSFANHIVDGKLSITVKDGVVTGITADNL